MITEYVLESYGYKAILSKYKGIWAVNLSQNVLYALSGIALQEYVSFLELIEYKLNELNTKKVG